MAIALNLRHGGHNGQWQRQQGGSSNKVGVCQCARAACAQQGQLRAWANFTYGRQLVFLLKIDHGQSCVFTKPAVRGQGIAPFFEFALQFAHLGAH